MQPKRSIVVILVFVLTVFVAGGGTAVAKTEKEKIEQHVLRITVSGQVYESQPPLQLFGSVAGAGLMDLTSAIRAAAKDEKVSSLVLRLNGASVGWTQRQALRRELIRFRESGKPSYCYLLMAGTGDYMLASACSKVYLHPTGMLELPGLSMDLMFMKGLLDKVGVRFEELRMGRYKSAVESMTRKGPSEPVVEQMNSILDELYSEMIDAIAENRGMNPVAVRALIDRAMFNADEAKAAKLIDGILQEDEFLSAVTKSKSLKLVEAKLGKSMELSSGGFAGMVQMLGMLFGGPRKEKISKNPKIAVIYGTGSIMVSGAGGLFGGEVMTSKSIVPLFRKVRNDDTVMAVVFRVSSPGGSALASDLIAREVELTAQKKPVVVSMGDVAASGGYYVSCRSDWIVSERGTLTGSIGVIGAIPDMKRLYEMIGVDFHRFSRGKRAGMVSPTGKLSEEGRRMLMKYMHEIYDDFLTHVSVGRKMSKESVASIAEGRVWTGAEALSLGLVDEIGGLDVAMAKARVLGKVPADAEILTLPRPKTIFDLLNEISAEGIALKGILGSLPREFRALLRRVEWVGCLRTERALCVWPEVLEIR